jgi:hypothetical protein
LCGNRETIHIAAINKKKESNDIYAAPRIFNRHIQDIIGRIRQSILTVVVGEYVN